MESGEYFLTPDWVKFHAPGLSIDIYGSGTWPQTFLTVPISKPILVTPSPSLLHLPEDAEVVHDVTYPLSVLKMTSVGSKFSLAVGGTHRCCFACLVLVGGV